MRMLKVIGYISGLSLVACGILYLLNEIAMNNITTIEYVDPIEVENEIFEQIAKEHKSRYK